MRKDSTSRVEQPKKRAPRRSKASSALADIRKGLAHLDYGSAISPSLPKHAIERPNTVRPTRKRQSKAR